MRHFTVVRTVLAALFAALLLPAAAHAGGWAITTLSSLPKDITPGKPWIVDLTVLQHGKTPLEGIEPAIVTTAPDGTRQRHLAKPTGKPGVYRAAVVFERPGRYSYAVDDGFTNVSPMSYPPVEVGHEAAQAARLDAAAPVGNDFPWELYLGGVAVLAATGAAVALLVRDRAGVQPRPV